MSAEFPTNPQAEIVVARALYIPSRGLSRRQLVKSAGLVIGGTAFGLLTACSSPAPEPSVVSIESRESIKSPDKDTLTPFRYGCLYNGTGLNFAFNRKRLNELSEMPFLNMNGRNMGLGILLDPGALEHTSLIINEAELKRGAKIHSKDQGFSLREWIGIRIDVDRVLRNTYANYPASDMPTFLQAFSENLSIRCVEIMITAISRDLGLSSSGVYQMTYEEAAIARSSPLPFQVLGVPY